MPLDAHGKRALGGVKPRGFWARVGVRLILLVTFSCLLDACPCITYVQTILYK